MKWEKKRITTKSAIPTAASAVFCQIDIEKRLDLFQLSQRAHIKSSVWSQIDDLLTADVRMSMTSECVSVKLILNVMVTVTLPSRFPKQ